MLSKKDYKDYFEQMMQLEIKARDIYQECVEKVGDADIKEACAKILGDEKRHISIVKKIMDLILK